MFDSANPYHWTDDFIRYVNRLGDGMKCSSCGQEIGPGNRFCGKCGTPVEQATPPVPEDEVSAESPLTEEPCANAFDNGTLVMCVYTEAGDGANQVKMMKREQNGSFTDFLLISGYTLNDNKFSNTGLE